MNYSFSLYSTLPPFLNFQTGHKRSSSSNLPKRQRYCTLPFLSIIFGSKWLFLLFRFLFYWFHCMSYHMCHLMSPSTNLPKNFHLIEIWKLFLILFGGHSFFHIGALIFFDKTNYFYLLVNIYGLINVFTRNKYLYWLKFGGLKRLPHLP